MIRIRKGFEALVSSPSATKLKNTLGMWGFSALKIPLILFLRPVVVRLDDEVCEVKIPLGYTSRNHLNSMYFGALCTGADVAGGLMAMRLIEEEKKKSGKNIQFVFKDFSANFLKRAESDVIFRCDQVNALRELVTLASESDERVETQVDVVATAPKTLNDEAVAKFKLTISLKQKTGTV